MQQKTQLNLGGRQILIFFVARTTGDRDGVPQVLALNLYCFEPMVL